jgi:hypothetical protein
MKNIGYVIRLTGKPNIYAYGLTLKAAYVFPTREAARRNKRRYADRRLEKIIQVELTKRGRAKRIIKEVR